MPERQPQRQPQRRGPPERTERTIQRQPPERKAPPLIDVHIRVGLEDVLMRLSPQDWTTLLHFWILGGEDVVLRSATENQETNIVLRGNNSGTAIIRHKNEASQAPRFKVIRASVMRLEILEKHGVGR